LILISQELDVKTSSTHSWPLSYLINLCLDRSKHSLEPFN